MIGDFVPEPYPLPTVSRPYIPRHDEHFSMPQTALIRGVGGIGSAVAHRLFSAGYNVVLHDEPQPATTRRKMAFSDAAFDGVTTLEGVKARRASDVPRGSRMFRGASRGGLPRGRLRRWSAPSNAAVFLDARMRKRAVPENQRPCNGHSRTRTQLQGWGNVWRSQ